MRTNNSVFFRVKRNEIFTNLWTLSIYINNNNHDSPLKSTIYMRNSNFLFYFQDEVIELLC